MTKEEAIKYLQQLYPNGGHCWLDERRIEAIGMAVKALQEEPVELKEVDLENYNKVQKIREEVARIQLYTQSEVLKQVLDYIDEVQKEPVSMWHDVSEEPKPNMELICVGQYGNPLVLSSNSDPFKSRDISKWAYFNDLLNLSNIHKTVKNWEESVREDLGDYINELSKQFPEVSFAKLSRIAVRVSKWQKEHLWKPADGDDLPEYEREVVVFTQNFPNDAGMMSVSIAHRPNPDGFDGKSLTTGEVEHYTPKTYGKGGWNIPNIVYWLDIELPKEMEL